jgi:VRR-NUC domain
MRNDREHQEQVTLINWSKYFFERYPALKLLHATPNGGQRNPIVAAKLKAEGVSAGFPDLSLPVARHGFHSLHIEMKVKPNTVKPEQKRWMENLEAEGNKTAVCWSWTDAALIICGYLDIDPRAAGIDPRRP